MRSEKIGFYFKSPEIDFGTWSGNPPIEQPVASDLGSWGAAAEKKVSPEIDTSALVAEKLGVTAQEIKDSVDTRLADFGLTHQEQRPAVQAVTEVTPPIDNTGDMITEPEPEPEPEIVPEIVLNLHQYDRFVQEHFVKVDDFLMGAEYRSKKGGGTVVDGEALKTARVVLRQAGFSNEQIDQIDKQEDVVFKAKEWVLLRRAGSRDFVSDDAQESKTLVLNVKRYLKERSQWVEEDRQEVKTKIKTDTGWDDTQFERIVNLGILVNENQKNRLVIEYGKAIKEMGVLVSGNTESIVAQGINTVGGLYRTPGVDISRMVAFVNSAGVEVNGNTTWADLVDKRNIVLLQLMVDQKDAKATVLALTPDQRREKTKELIATVWGAFLENKNGNVSIKDPTKDELDALATKFMYDFAPMSKRGKTFVLDYMANYREHLKQKYNATFKNENVNKKDILTIKDKAMLDGLLLMEYEQIYLGREHGRTYSFANVTGLPVTADQLIDMAENQGIITYAEKQEILDRREAVKALVKLQAEMNVQSNVTDTMLSASGDLERNRRMEKLVKMQVRKKEGDTTKELIMINGEPATIAHVIAAIDARARQKINSTNGFYDIWDDTEFASLKGMFGGNEMAVKIARDLYFVTAGAARYEYSRRYNDGGEMKIKKQKRGAIDFRDLLNPLEIRYAKNGYGDNFARDREFLRYGDATHAGVNLRVLSFWDWDNPQSNTKTEVKRVADYRKSSPDVPFHDWPPLDVQRINGRIAALYDSQEPKLLFAWMKRMKSAEALMKAEEEFLLADDKDDRWNKFKALTTAYGFMGAEAKEAFGERVFTHYEYQARRNNTKHSGLDMPRSSIRNTVFTYVRKYMEADQYNRLVNTFNNDKRFYNDKRTGQAASEQQKEMSEIKRSAILGFLFKVFKDILAEGFK